MNQWTVLAALERLTPIDEESRRLALSICGSCAEELHARLRPGVNPRDGRLIRCAAAMALYQLRLRQMAQEDDTASFQAGDIKITRRISTALEQARQVQRECLQAAAPLLQDEGFYVGRVKIGWK